MTEPRRTSRVSPKTQKYNPSAIADEQRKREIADAQRKREIEGATERTPKKTTLEAIQSIKSMIKVGDELCDKEGFLWTVRTLGDDAGESNQIGLSKMTSGGGEYSCSRGFDAADFDAMLFQRPIAQSRALAFAMSSHARLGMMSAFGGLVPDIVQRIVQAAASNARFSKVDTASAPIPINLVLGGFSAIRVDLDELKAPMKRAIGNTLVGWKWKSSLENGFGSITPTRISWAEICSLAVPQITDGYDPGDGQVEGFPLLVVDESFVTMQKPAHIMKAYSRACQRGDQDFEIAYKDIWHCGHQNPCLGGDNLVLLAGGTHKLVRDLCVGDTVLAAGIEETALITATWRSCVGRTIEMVSVQGVLVTPDHPVCCNGTWRLPSSLSPPQPLFVDAVFNFALSAGHSLMLLPGAATAAGAGRGAGTKITVRAGQGGLKSVEPASGGYVQCCTLGMDVPGMPDTMWGTERIFEAIRTVPGYPQMVTVY